MQLAIVGFESLGTRTQFDDVMHSVNLSGVKTLAIRKVRCTSARTVMYNYVAKTGAKILTYTCDNANHGLRAKQMRDSKLFSESDALVCFVYDKSTYAIVSKFTNARKPVWIYELNRFLHIAGDKKNVENNYCPLNGVLAKSDKA